MLVAKFLCLSVLLFSQLPFRATAVYEACKLGSHTPQINGGLMDSSSGKLSSSGFLLVNCPQELKVGSSNMLSISSITNYFDALSKCWNVKGYLNSVKKVLKDLKLASNPLPNHKEQRNIGPCMVCLCISILMFFQLCLDNNWVL